MSAPEITSELEFDRVKIKIGGVLHLSLRRSKFIGLQAWRVLRESNYVIEYTMEGGNIMSEYDTPEKWKAVLSEMDKYL